MRLLSPTCVTMSGEPHLASETYDLKAFGEYAKRKSKWKYYGFWSPFGPRWFELLRDRINRQSAEIVESRLEPVSIGNVA
jgi:hypothetical protein